MACARHRLCWGASANQYRPQPRSDFSLAGQPPPPFFFSQKSQSERTVFDTGVVPAASLHMSANRNIAIPTGWLFLPCLFVCWVIEARGGTLFTSSVTKPPSLTHRGPATDAKRETAAGSAASQSSNIYRRSVATLFRASREAVCTVQAQYGLQHVCYVRSFYLCKGQDNPCFPMRAAGHSCAAKAPQGTGRLRSRRTKP